MSAAHTPGPWQADGSHIYGPDPDPDLVCQVLSGYGRALADRRLIAAAPDLLEALQQVMRAYGATIHPLTGGNMALAAIAKATVQ